MVLPFVRAFPFNIWYFRFQVFDPSLLKKKKKKKTTFDLDAALGLDDAGKKEDPKDEGAADATAAELEDNLDLESFGKKKKKKKKPFNLDELEGALPDGADDVTAAATADDPEEEEINLDMDFSMAKKKKKSKKKDLDELFADKLDDDKSEDKENCMLTIYADTMLYICLICNLYF